MSELLNRDNRSVVADYDRLRDDCALIELPAYALIELLGEDRKGWLQGQVTQDVRGLEFGASSSFCFCNANGQILSLADAWALQDRIVFSVPIDTRETVTQRIEQMVVMESVEHVDVTKKVKWVSIQGPRASQLLSEFVSLPPLDAGTATLEGAEIYVLRSKRTVAGGWDLWVPAAKRKALSVLRNAFHGCGEEAFEIARLEAGLPKFGSDISTKTIAMEMGPAFVSRFVNLQKGCYVGQEVLQRIHSRGHTNRTWVGLLSEQPLTVGATIDHHRQSGIGVVTSAADSPDLGYIGAAVVRNQAAFDGETVRVHSNGSSFEAEVRVMPLLRLD